MSDLTHRMQGTRDAAPIPPASAVARAHTRRRAATIGALAVVAWSIIELVSLAWRHTVGPELYGVLVAAVAVGAAVLGLVALRSSRRRGRLAILALVVWAVVAIGGIGGVAAHMIGPSGHGPADPRPRPPLAPLAFTAMGVAGALTVVLGYRGSATRTRTAGEE